MGLSSWGVLCGQGGTDLEHAVLAVDSVLL